MELYARIRYVTRPHGSTHRLIFALLGGRLRSGEASSIGHSGYPAFQPADATASCSRDHQREMNDVTPLRQRLRDEFATLTSPIGLRMLCTMAVMMAIPLFLLVSDDVQEVIVAHGPSCRCGLVPQLILSVKGIPVASLLLAVLSGKSPQRP